MIMIGVQNYQMAEQVGELNPGIHSLTQPVAATEREDEPPA